jgi:hypothetical protein
MPEDISVRASAPLRSRFNSGRRLRYEDEHHGSVHQERHRIEEEEQHERTRRGDEPTCERTETDPNIHDHSLHGKGSRPLLR